MLNLDDEVLLKGVNNGVNLVPVFEYQRVVYLIVYLKRDA